MDGDMVVKIVEAVLIVICFVLGRYVVPRIPNEFKEAVKNKTDKAFNALRLAATWAEKFIVMEARFSKCSGAEKMEHVIAAVQKVLAKYDITMTDEEVKAIAQECYENLIGNFDFDNDNKEDAKTESVELTSGDDASSEDK